MLMEKHKELFKSENFEEKVTVNQIMKKIK